MDITEPVLLWVDVETSGLDPRTDALLEVAALLTDADLRPLTGAHFHALVAHTPGEVAALHEAADPFVRAMHDANGLWEAVQGPDALSADEVDAALLAFTSRAAPTPRQARVAGNSVRLDMNFMDAYLPRTAAHVHYRSVDVTAVQFLVDEWYGPAPATSAPKPSDHTALADIEASLDQLRALRARIGTLCA